MLKIIVVSQKSSYTNDIKQQLKWYLNWQIHHAKLNTVQSNLQYKAIIVKLKVLLGYSIEVHMWNQKLIVGTYYNIDSIPCS